MTTLIPKISTEGPELEAFNLGASAGERVIRESPFAWGLAEHPMASAHLTARNVIGFLGGIECAQAGFDVDNPLTWNFMEGYIAAMFEAMKG